MPAGGIWPALTLRRIFSQVSASRSDIGGIQGLYGDAGGLHFLVVTGHAVLIEQCAGGGWRLLCKSGWKNGKCKGGDQGRNGPEGSMTFQAGFN